MSTDVNDAADLDAIRQQLHAARDGGKITAPAVANVTKWLTEPRYAEYSGEVTRHIQNEEWQALDDAFWTIIPFGTGGRRGKMYPIGCNAINDRTIGESARGLAEYVLEQLAADVTEPSCAIAFDTRHNSRHFAQLCAEVMVAAGLKVYFLDEFRSTPALSFMVRHKSCDCGIMVTASHNPPSDNAVKCYWSTGGQILPPHDQGVIDRVMEVEEIPRIDFQSALADGRIEVCVEEIDRGFQEEVTAQRFAGPRDVKIIYSPLHGVGSTAVVPALAADGFDDVELFEPHAKPDGDFPNVPGHVSNPENPTIFEAMIEHARTVQADLILATDPDCDRVGCAAPTTSDATGPWKTLTGNQLGALLTDYILESRRQTGQLSADHYLVKTLVTTEMIRRIGESYGVRTIGNLLVGFKWIGGVIDEQGAEHFVFGAEESHGYLVGQYARDKDGAVAAMLLAEVAAAAKARNQSVHEKLESLFWQHGYHEERLVNQMMTGSRGMARMKSLMDKLRGQPPRVLGGLAVKQVRDYVSSEIRDIDGDTTPLDGPRGNMVILDLTENGNYVAVRPSGTEPKVKFYMFGFVPAEQLADLDLTRGEVQARLDHISADLAAFADSV